MTSRALLSQVIHVRAGTLLSDSMPYVVALENKSCKGPGPGPLVPGHGSLCGQLRRESAIYAAKGPHCFLKSFFNGKGSLGDAFGIT